ncbi:MAG: VWA domain-containing protein, partial [Oscillospiraceae bacterium]|nr:VWA domain-containing protein [Oscillospiraceae bacterium]
RITSVFNPAGGSATMINSNTVEWRISSLGVSGSEGAVLEFNVQHVGQCTGVVPVNESVSYSDSEGNIVTFPSPEIDVNCGIDVIPESCPVPIEIPATGCGDTIEFDAGDLALSSVGRILQLDVTLQNVCPNKRVALAVILNETDAEGNEYRRGMKTMTIPAHTEASCRDVNVRCIKFVLPEDLDVSGTGTGTCNTRNFNARFFANYIDSDFECCSAAT